MNEKISDLIKQSEVSIMSNKCFKGYIDIEKFSQLLINDVLNETTAPESLIMKVKEIYAI